MANGDYVDHNMIPNTTAVNQYTQPVAGAVADNFVVAGIALSNLAADADFQDPGNLYELLTQVDDNTENYHGAVVAKVADGTDSINWDWTGDMRQAMAHVELAWDGSAYDNTLVTVHARTTAPASIGSIVAPANAVAAVTFLIAENYSDWATQTEDIGGRVTIDGGWTKRDFQATQAGHCAIAVATKKLSGGETLTGSWATTDTDGGGDCFCVTFILAPVAADANWSYDSDDIEVTLDQPGLGGVANTASRVKFKTADAILYGKALTQASMLNAGRYWAKRHVGTGAIRASLDGVTWTDITTSVNGGTPDAAQNDFIPIPWDQTVANPQLRVQGATVNDEIVIGNAELVPEFSAAELVGVGPIYALDILSTFKLILTC